jgi:cholesterol transport system auxiliary component
MMGKRVTIVAAAALATLALSGCFGGGRLPAALLTLSPAQAPPAATGPRAVTAGEAITVATPDAPRAITANRVPVYVDATTIQYLRGAQWIESPSDLFRDLLSETIAARTHRAVLDPALYTEARSAVLNGRLLRFGLDPNAHEAVIEYEAALTRADAGVVTNRFSARVRVADEDAGTVAAALNAAANEVAGEVAAWIGG